MFNVLLCMTTAKEKDKTVIGKLGNLRYSL